MKHSIRKRAFTVVEIAIAVAIIAVLTALALPAYKRSKDSTKIAALENDLRVYAQSFETYALENKDYPQSQPTTGVFPVGMEGRLPQGWTEPSPVGGQYRLSLIHI